MKTRPSPRIRHGFTTTLLAGGACLLGLALATPALAQLVLPPSTMPLPPCPNGTQPCVTFSYPHVENAFILNQFQAREGQPPDPSPVDGPAEYYDVTFSNMGGYSISNGSFRGWSTEAADFISREGPYYIFNTYVKMPQYPWNGFSSQFKAANWLLNHKPSSVTYTPCDSNGNCSGTATTNDERTIRDVIQQAIWMLFNNGTASCCSLLDPHVSGNPPPPTHPQYNGSYFYDPTYQMSAGGGYNISAAANALYSEAMTHTDFVPGPGDIFVLFILDSTGALIEIPQGPPPHLTVTKTPKTAADPGYAFLPGGQATFKIKVTNDGATAATNVQLTDQLPTNGGMTWTSYTATQGTCAISASYVLTCSLGTIAAAASVDVTVSSPATTPPAACAPQPNGSVGPPIVPGVTVTADGGLTASDWGALTCSNIPPGPQLRVVKTPDGGSFSAGNQVSFTIIVSNPAALGDGSATNVQLTDQLPTNGGLTWTSVTTSQGNCSINATYLLSCSLGTIPPQGAVMITVSSPATTPVAACQPQLNPAATATADPNLTATDSGSLNCTCGPNLTVAKSPKGGTLGTFAQGGQASFTIVVGNPSGQCSQPATNVKLTDALPTNGGLTWTTATTTQGTCSITSNVLNCSLGTIAGGGSVLVTASSPASTPVAACQSQPNPAATATADGGLTATDTGLLNCYPPQLTVVKNPKPPNNKFYLKSQASFSFVVSNPAAPGGSPATNVTLTDQLPTIGGLTWTSYTTTQGTCSISGTYVLTCNLGTILAQGSVTVEVLSPASTPEAACQLQPNGQAGPPIVPGVTVTADGGLTATDWGSLYCDPGPNTPGCPFWVRYATNLDVGESYVTIANDGANGAPLLPGLGSASGNLCINVYTFDPSEMMLSCCSCLVTPNQVQYLRVKQDLVSNLVGGLSPNSVTVKLLATLAGTGGSGTSCTNSAATVTTSTVVPGMEAWGTTLHATPVTGIYDTTETPFICASLSTSELNSLAHRCAAIVGDLSGFGRCGPCRPLP